MRRSTSVQPGNRYGRLTVLNEDATVKISQKRKWICKCDCGKEKSIKQDGLMVGTTKSCGCLARETNRTHGMRNTGTGGAWTNMMGRCYRKSQASYPNYGGKGILPCDFIKATPRNLLAILGEKPDGLTLDRIDNSHGYNCGQCEHCAKNRWRLNIRWATTKEQCRNTSYNRMVTIGGVARCTVDWADALGIGRSTFRHRVLRGYTEEQLAQPVKKR